VARPQGFCFVQLMKLHGRLLILSHPETAITKLGVEALRCPLQKKPKTAQKNPYNPLIWSLKFPQKRVLFGRSRN
jgi:hypothetical protein